MQESIFVLKSLLSRLIAGNLVVKEGDEWMIGNRIEDLIQAVKTGTKEKQSGFSVPYSVPELEAFFSNGDGK